MPREIKRRTGSPAKKQGAAIATTSAAAAPARSLSTRRATHASRTSPGRVRIVGGLWKRTPIVVPDIAGLRPTPDRVRETVFNWLSFLCPEMTSVRGLDLFAGTGALGFELASRGARSVVLVEREPYLVTRLQALKERLDARQVEILNGDALAVAARLAAEAFDIVFLDPPFDSGLLFQALERVRTLLAPHGIVYAESGAPIVPEQARTLGMEVLRAGQAGQVRFHLLRRDGS
jgi:16S rRNA (guanine(966)-N(2))-methyltransferase RsmD